ncbi:hypothetical protein [Sphingobacterium hungaricum]|uniref:Uncharacterized protein n=1 Tax=Sphingobacterium hungaricum TaxID=2082723 RepID=A0A928YQR9_9SPHI|nr:hypothetical protein [Sphingobacterium hungaricum]MBE8712633.1 hypothetical protein [Sphingobacterium hungaricum]
MDLERLNDFEIKVSSCESKDALLDFVKDYEYYVTANAPHGFVGASGWIYYFDRLIHKLKSLESSPNSNILDDYKEEYLSCIIAINKYLISYLEDKDI